MRAPLKAGTALPPVLLLAAACLLPPAALHGHIVTQGAGTAAVLSIQEGKVLITFDMGFAEIWGQAEMVSMDRDRDGQVGEDEAEAYMRRSWDERLAPHLDLQLDGARLTLRRLSSREDNLLGEISPVAFNIYYELEAELPPGWEAPGKVHRLVFENNALKRESPSLPTFYIPMDRESHIRGLSFQILEPPPLLDVLGPADMYTMLGRKLVVTFDFNEGRPPAPEAKGASQGPEPAKVAAKARAPQARARIEEDLRQPEDRFFTDAFQSYGKLGLWEKLVLICLAMLYGAGHALAPGHGKAIVAAYLVGSRGRIADAVILGLATMFSHTITVFLAGLGLYLAVAYGAAASPEPIKNRIVVATSLISGLLLFLMGLILFFRRWRYAGDPEAMHHHGHSHHHGHHHHHGPPHQHEPDHPGHDHPHGPAPGGGRPTFWSLVGIGTSGGLVPCPAGIVVILLGLHFQDRGALLFSLLLLVFFSLALGSVLVAIGIFVVTGRQLFEGKVKVSPRVLSYVPALSALFIAGLGTYFTVQTVRTGRTEIAAMLETLAAAIR